MKLGRYTDFRIEDALFVQLADQLVSHSFYGLAILKHRLNDAVPFNHIAKIGAVPWGLHLFF